MPNEELNNNGISFGEEYDSKGEFELIDDGVYEVTIAKIEPRISKKGNKCLNFTFEIIEDENGNRKFQRRKLFYNVTQKEGDKCYDFPRINKLILTQKGTDNYRTHFAEFDEVIQYLVGINLRLTVETNYDEYSAKDRNEVKDWSFEPSQLHVSASSDGVQFENGKNGNEISDIQDEDLPF